MSLLEKLAILKSIEGILVEKREENEKEKEIEKEMEKSGKMGK